MKPFTKEIVIFVPTKKEAAAVFNSDSFCNYKGTNYLSGQKHKVVITGMGKVNAALTLSLYLNENPAITPILLGIAGAYRSSEIEIGSVYMISKDHFVDEALLTSSEGRFTLQSTNEMGFEICPNNYIQFNTLPLDLPSANSNTVSLLAGTDELSEIFHSKTGAELENMEGAGFGLAAAYHNIKAVQIRAVSNYCGDRKNQQWDIKKAFKGLQETLKKIYEL